MIEKFNFYDLYGYFLPGFVLLALLWLPWGIVDLRWPAAAASSAVLAVGASYVIGHILQSIAVSAAPPHVRDKEGKYRFPSQVLLDNEDPTLTQEFKVKLSELVRLQLGIDLGVGKPRNEMPERERLPIDFRRRDAFFLCRSVLIKEKIASYAEQFEGMYSLMLGLAAAFALGSGFVAGWALSWFNNCCMAILGGLAVGLGLLLAGTTTVIVQAAGGSYTQRSSWDKFTFAGLLVASLGAGCLLGSVGIACRQAASWAGLSGQQHLLFVGISLGELLISVRCFGAYKRFAKDFARAVWQDFACHQLVPSKAAPHARGSERHTGEPGSPQENR